MSWTTPCGRVRLWRRWNPFLSRNLRLQRLEWDPVTDPLPRSGVTEITDADNDRSDRTSLHSILQLQRRVYCREEDVSIFRDIIHRGAFIQQRDLEEFERNLAQYLGVKHAIGVAMPPTDWRWLGVQQVYAWVTR